MRIIRQVGTMETVPAADLRTDHRHVFVMKCRHHPLGPVQQGVVVHNFGLLSALRRRRIAWLPSIKPVSSPWVRFIEWTWFEPCFRASSAKDFTVGPYTATYLARDIGDRNGSRRLYKPMFKPG